MMQELPSFHFELLSLNTLLYAIVNALTSQRKNGDGGNCADVVLVI
jgi:hypothetical protein